MQTIRIIEEFRKKKPLYEDFTFAVYKLIDSILQEGKYKYQIFYRIKDPDKLGEKIHRKKKEGKIYSSLEKIEDLSGLRIIFYYEIDKVKFLKEMRKEITGDLEIISHNKKSGYEAVHIIASFGNKRIKLSEYKRFKDLKCEIQLVSILHHAWAEIEHDLLYKNDFKINNKKQLLIYEKEMQDILEKHIKIATKKFNQIIKNFKN
ncbi:MAG: hypothetical protein WA101_01895 [Minisyncoccia bacterium]